MASLPRIGNYRLGKTLGVGSFGKVKLAEHEPTGKKVAVKILNRQRIRMQQMEEKLKREIKILKMCEHPHIIRLYEVIETPTDVFVVTEYSAGGELFDYIVEQGRLSEPEARRFFQQIIAGVEYCHAHMVAHRDLKPENLLLDEKSRVKIADFGLSNCMRDGWFLKTSCGSPNYAAPEVISGKLYAGPEVDIWSCGVIAYALLCGSLPFDDESIPYLFRKIKGGIYILPSYLSESSKDLISRMLVTDPLKRITIEGIRSHPWFLDGLPRYLAVPPRVGHQLEGIDHAVLQQVVTCTGFPQAKIVNALHKGRRNHYTVAYNVLKDAQTELDTSMSSPADVSGLPSSTNRELSVAESANTLQTATNAIAPTENSEMPTIQNGPLDLASSGVASSANASGVPGASAGQADGGSVLSGIAMGTSTPNSTQPPGGEHPVGAVLPQPQQGMSIPPSPNMMVQTPMIGSHAPTAQQSGQGMMVPNAQVVHNGTSVVENVFHYPIMQKWVAGVNTGRQNPAEVMMEVYRALHHLQWRWKTPANQNFQVRVLVMRPGLADPVRLCLQLFKTTTGYMLDIHRLDGDMIAFFVVCSDLLRELHL